jgi:hypothetical protein
MACHGGTGSLPQGERPRHAKTWTLAGTVFEPPPDTAVGVEGAEIEIVDADGFSFSLRSNLAGNFYSRESVRLPLSACIARGGATICQQSPVTSGACNSCHGLPQLGAPQPPLTAP